MRYKAFISYSHAIDNQLAPALQRALQRFAKPWNKISAMRVFRDKTSLSADPSLWNAIERALDDSEFFVLLASPVSAESEWVQREVSHWIEQRGTDNFLIVLTDGEIEWDPNVQGLDWKKTTALPELLAGQIEEPLYVDLRWARHADDLSLNHPKFRDKVADLASTLHRVSKDQIAGREVREHRKQIRMVWSAATGLAILTVTAVGLGIFAELQRKKATTRLIDSFVEQGRQEFLDGNLSRAAVALSQAYSLGGDGPALKYLLARSIEPLSRITEVVDSSQGANQAVAFSSNSQYAATVSDSGVIRMWRVASGEELWSQAIDHTLRGVAFASSGEAVVVWQDGKRLLYAWDSESGKQLQDIPKNIILRDLTYDTPNIPITNAKGTRMVAQLGERFLLHDQQSGDLINQLDFGESTSNRVLFNTNGRVLYTPEAGGSPRVWDAQTGSLLLSADAVYDYTFSAVNDHGTQIAVGGDRTETVSIYDIDSGTVILRLAGHAGGVESIHYSPDGKYLLVAGHGEAKLWDAKTGAQVSAFYSATSIIEAQFSPDGNHAYTRHVDGSVRFWKMPGYLSIANQYPIFDKLGLIQKVDPLNDGLWLVSGDRGVAVWQPRDRTKFAALVEVPRQELSRISISPDLKRVVIGSTLRTIPSLEVIAELGDSATGTFVFTSDGARLVTVGSTPTVWNAKSGAPIFTLSHAAQYASYDPSSLRIVSAQSYEGPLQLWDAIDGSLIDTITVSDIGDANPVIFSSNGLRFAALSKNGPLFFDTKNGEALKAPRADKMKPLLTSTDNLLLTQLNGSSERDWSKVTAWDFDTTRKLQQVPSSLSSNADGPIINTYHSSPNGQYLLITYGDIIWNPTDSPKIWDLESGSLVSSLQGHTDLIVGGSFSADDSLVITYSRDGSAKVWEASSGTLLQEFESVGTAKALFLKSESKLAIWSHADVNIIDTHLESSPPESIAKLLCLETNWRLINGRIVPANQDSTAAFFPCK